jgi:hypothetical protein
VSGVDDVEYANLAEQVRRIELLVDADTRGDSSYLLKSFLHNAKSRMDELRPDEIRTEDEKKEQKAKETAGIAQLAEMEHRLSAREKQQYSEFLNLDYFTKANFDELESFYADGGAWDKLSESGKAQMSHRVWEGIRRDEYDFDELPDSVRKKESERLYQQLTGQIQSDPNLAKITQQDRVDFIREHEAGNEKEATQVLNRESFSQHVGRSASIEADHLKESKSGEKFSDKSMEKTNAGELDELAASFGDDQNAVKPTHLGDKGSGLFRS